MKRIFKIFLLLSLILAEGFSANFVWAANPLDVVINEIAWMGTKVEGAEPKNQWRYEWLELYNNTEKEINLTGWEIENIKAKKETLKIPKGEILPKDYFLICKRKLKEKCNLEIKELSLNNDYKKNGKLVLKDKEENIVDQTPEANNKKWTAGNNKTKQTMERKVPKLTGGHPDNWQTSQNPGGTPKAKNSAIESPAIEVKPQQSEPQQSEPQQPETTKTFSPQTIIEPIKTKLAEDSPPQNPPQNQGVDIETKEHQSKNQSKKFDDSFTGLKEKKLIAATGKQLSESSNNSLFILLIALVVAIFSGTIILILKRKIEKPY